MKFSLEQRKKLMILSHERLVKVKESQSLLDSAQWDYHYASHALNVLDGLQDDNALKLLKSGLAKESKASKSSSLKDDPNSENQETVSKFNFFTNITNQEIYFGKYKIPEIIKHGIAVDLGANVGLFETKYHNRFNMIYAFEASYQNFLETIDNIQKNDISNALCFNLAAAKDSNEIIKIYRNSGIGTSVSCTTTKEMLSAVWNGIHHPDYNADQQPEVWKEKNESYHNVMTVSLEGIYDLLEVDYIDYLKIDIEGAEYDFLLGKDLSRIGAIGLEIHGPFGEEKKQELKDYLLKYFDIYHIESDETPSPENDWRPTISEITYINKDLK